MYNNACQFAASQIAAVSPQTAMRQQELPGSGVFEASGACSHRPRQMLCSIAVPHGPYPLPDKTAEGISLQASKESDTAGVAACSGTMGASKPVDRVALGSACTHLTPPDGSVKSRLDTLRTLPVSSVNLKRAPPPAPAGQHSASEMNCSLLDSPQARVTSL